MQNESESSVPKRTKKEFAREIVRFYMESSVYSTTGDEKWNIEWPVSEESDVCPDHIIQEG